mgnify:FL=1
MSVVGKLLPSNQYLTRAARVTVDFAAYVAVRGLVAVIQTLPLDMGDSLCRSLAWLAAGPMRIRHGVIEQNLAMVFPDADDESRRRLTLAMWHHLLLMVCEIAWAQRRLHLVNWSQHVRFLEAKKMLHHYLSGRPVVSVTGHYGNFEVGGYVTGLMGFETLAIARTLDNRFLHRWVEEFRGAKGQRMVDKQGCANRVEQHLQSNGILALLADQHAGSKGCWVDFLGVLASSHKALALFSLSSDAPMLVGFMRRVDRRPMQFELGLSGIVDPLDDAEGTCASVTTLTQWYNAKLAEAIAPAVEQYWWLHRRWRQPPEKVLARHRRAAQRKAA